MFLQYKIVLVAWVLVGIRSDLVLTKFLGLRANNDNIYNKA